MRDPHPTRSPTSPPDFPVREYIGSMARELAGMARRDRDDVLAALLDAAGERAAQGAQRLTSPVLSRRRQVVVSNPKEPMGTSPARR